MEPINAQSVHHAMLTSLAALTLIILRMWLRKERRRRRHIELRAGSGGVVVGRNNSGRISTGSAVGAKSEKPSRDWIDFSGAIAAILGAVIAALAWFFPRIPQ
jgi:hypothetical protein